MRLRPFSGNSINTNGRERCFFQRLQLLVLRAGLAGGGAQNKYSYRHAACRSLCGMTSRHDRKLRGLGGLHRIVVGRGTIDRNATWLHRLGHNALQAHTEQPVL